MDYPRKLNVTGEDLPNVYERFRETYPWVKKRAFIVGGGNSAGEAALFLAEGVQIRRLRSFATIGKTPTEAWLHQILGQTAARKELKEHCLNLFFLGKVIEISRRRSSLRVRAARTCDYQNDVVFVLIGSDADLTMLKTLASDTESGKHGEVPVYDAETFETNVPGVYVAGHFTHQRHIKGAIDAPKKIIPVIASKLARAAG